MAKNLPITGNVDTIPTLTPEMAKELTAKPKKDKETGEETSPNPAAKHDNIDGFDAGVLVWFHGDWYMVSLDDLSAITKKA